LLLALCLMLMLSHKLSKVLLAILTAAALTCTNVDPLDIEAYWLGNVPCRNVRLVGILIAATEYESRSIYLSTRLWVFSLVPNPSLTIAITS
jgi:hypothetical protein